MSFKEKYWILILFCVIIMFSGCWSTGNYSSEPSYPQYTIYTVSSVPDPFDKDVLFDKAESVLRDNYPNMSIEHQNMNLFSIDEIQQVAWVAMADKFDNPYSFSVYLVNTQKYPDYWTIYIIYAYKKPSGTLTYTYSFYTRVVKLVQK